MESVPAKKEIDSRHGITCGYRAERRELSDDVVLCWQTGLLAGGAGQEFQSCLCQTAIRQKDPSDSCRVRIGITERADIGVFVFAAADEKCQFHDGAKPLPLGVDPRLLERHAKAVFFVILHGTEKPVLALRFVLEGKLNCLRFIHLMALDRSTHERPPEPSQQGDQAV